MKFLRPVNRGRNHAAYEKITLRKMIAQTDIEVADIDRTPTPAREPSRAALPVVRCSQHRPYADASPSPRPSPHAPAFSLPFGNALDSRTHPHSHAQLRPHLHPRAPTSAIPSVNVLVGSASALVHTRTDTLARPHFHAQSRPSPNPCVPVSALPIGNALAWRVCARQYGTRTRNVKCGNPRQKCVQVTLPSGISAPNGYSYRVSVYRTCCLSPSAPPEIARGA